MRSPTPATPGLSRPLLGSREAARAHAIAFVIGLSIAALPLFIVYARFASFGEVDLLSVPTGPVALHGRITKASDAEYKLGRVIATRPDILVLGSSRVLGIRREMFAGCAAREDCLYNAGGQKPTLRHAEGFLRELAEQGVRPKVLLLALDPWDFIASYVPSDVPDKHAATQIQRNLLQRLRSDLGVVRDLLDLARTDRDLRERLMSFSSQPASREGLSAILREAGLRPDGSYEWGPRAQEATLATAPSLRHRDMVDSAVTASRPFTPFEAPDPTTLAELGRIVRDARSSGTAVVVFVPVLPEPVHRAFWTTHGCARASARCKRGWSRSPQPAEPRSSGSGPPPLSGAPMTSTGIRCIRARSAPHA